MRLVFRALLTLVLFTALIGKSAAQLCSANELFGHYCSCPYGTSHMGQSTYQERCGAPCSCLPNSYSAPPQHRGAAPKVSPAPQADTDEPATRPEPSSLPPPAHKRTEQYWQVSASCAPSWNYFHEVAVHGAFAVTKYIDGGGCGWSWTHPGGPSRSIETMRREALQSCAKNGPDCKIIDEK